MRFLVHTYGCQMNVRDSEAVEALLEGCGHERARSEADADLIIVNTCSVRGKAEEKALGKLGLLCAGKRDHPDRIVGVMGCMAQRLHDTLFRRIPLLDFAVGTRASARVPALLDRVRAGEGPLCELGGGADAEEGAGRSEEIVIAHHAGLLQAYVTILLGCERRCAYCIVPDVRGPEFSRPASEIVKEVRAVVAAGAKDVTLLGQSVMRYGVKTAVWPEHSRSALGYAEPLPRLFETLAAEIPELCRLRFTSGHPSGVTSELVRAMSEIPCLCPHLHLPVQSGSDRMLARMGRGYTRSRYLDAVLQLRAAVPDLAVTTDVIVGFPGESEEDFEQTRSLLDSAGIDNAFIFKYSPRPGTRASDWEDDVPPQEKMRRNQVLLKDMDILGVRRNERWVGRTVEVLAEGVSLRNKRRWAGRMPQNKIVVFEPVRSVAVGEMVRVRIRSAQPQTLHGELVS